MAFKTLTTKERRLHKILFHRNLIYAVVLSTVIAFLIAFYLFDCRNECSVGRVIYISIAGVFGLLALVFPLSFFVKRWIWFESTWRCPQCLYEHERVSPDEDLVSCLQSVHLGSHIQSCDRVSREARVYDWYVFSLAYYIRKSALRYLRFWRETF